MIFISYAKEDQAFAQDIYLALRRNGLAPWMDKPPAPFASEGLKIGEKWASVLQEKIAQAHYIILVLSPRSVSKRGYVQVEFRAALDRMNYLPDNEVLVLPILMEGCVVPSLTVGRINLSDLQWEVVGQNQIQAFVLDLAVRIQEIA